MNYVLLIILVVVLYLLIKYYYQYEFFTTEYGYDKYAPNKNAFGNYYRVGYENGENIGWKPTQTWDDLTPQNNEKK
jgi:hypothetical protein